MTKQTIAKRSDCPNLDFQAFISMPDKPVNAIQLKQADTIEHPFASNGGFQGIAASWKITYGIRPDGTADIAICQNDVFQSTYEHLGGSRYQKKTNIVTQAARLEAPMDIMTLEGASHAESGDWVLVGADGDLHFCDNDVFVARYKAHE